MISLLHMAALYASASAAAKIVLVWKFVVKRFIKKNNNQSAKQMTANITNQPPAQQPQAVQGIDKPNGQDPARRLIIAIDGPSASGKGTMARKIAAKMNCAYLDTGILYRATALILRRQGKDGETAAAADAAARSIDEQVLAELSSDPALREEATSALTSKIAAYPSVRAILLGFQVDFAHRQHAGKNGAVLDGRDIGTVVCPHADVKLYITASAQIRARRRFLELQARGECVSEQIVRNAMAARDARDSSRSAAPALPAEDAVVIDTTDLDADSAFAAVLNAIADKLKRF